MYFRNASFSETVFQFGQYRLPLVFSPMRRSFCGNFCRHVSPSDPGDPAARIDGCLCYPTMRRSLSYCKTPCICHRCPSGVSAFNNTRKPSFGGPLCFPVLLASCHTSIKEPMLILRGLPDRVDSSCCSGPRAAIAPS